MLNETEARDGEQFNGTFMATASPLRASQTETAE
jgi:hypothetical protein